MKKLLVSIVFIVSGVATYAQKSPVPGEFSNPTIFVGSVVTDLAKSVDFYTNIIGMTKTSEFSVDGPKAKELGLTDGRSVDVTVLKLEDSPQANEWKLMSFGTKPGHKKPNYLHDDTGMQYITILVNHLEPIMKRIEKNNIKILSGKPSDLGQGRLFILVQDPDGTFIELIGAM
ncbi:MAG TPA: VOC family protein [Draconibacterium sp.]|nr:VOC family protein [Draconibacterium sp.]HRX11524.1 VOC family protein [Draconibacterium sp.]